MLPGPLTSTFCARRQVGYLYEINPLESGNSLTVRILHFFLFFLQPELILNCFPSELNRLWFMEKVGKHPKADLSIEMLRNVHLTDKPRRACVLPLCIKKTQVKG